MGDGGGVCGWVGAWVAWVSSKGSFLRGLFRLKASPFASVRALGETDLNPVSGLGKLAQLAFAFLQPGNVIANIVAGGVAEAGAQQGQSCPPTDLAMC